MKREIGNIRRGKAKNHLAGEYPGGLNRREEKGLLEVLVGNICSGITVLKIIHLKLKNLN